MSLAQGYSASVGEEAPRLSLDPVRDAILWAYGVYLLLLGLAWWATLHLAPDQVSLRLLGHTMHESELHRRVLTRGLEIALLVPSVIMAELAVVGWKQSSLRELLVERSPSAMSDVAVLGLWHTPLMNWLTVGATFGLALVSGEWLRQRFAAATGLDGSIAGLPVLVQAPLLYALYTFFDYWTHRIDHTEVFWPIHRFHHAATDFTVLNSSRTHPAAFTGIVFTTLPLALLGASPEALVDINLFVVGLRFVIHSRIDSNFGWIGRTLVQSPQHHRLHHIRDMSEPVGHYALMPLWDRLFGTWRGEADQSLPIGVAAPYRHGLWVAPDMARDYADFLSRAWLRLTGRGRALVRDQIAAPSTGS